MKTSTEIGNLGLGTKPFGESCFSGGSKIGFDDQDSDMEILYGFIPRPCFKEGKKRTANGILTETNSRRGPTSH